MRDLFVGIVAGIPIGVVLTIILLKSELKSGHYVDAGPIEVCGESGGPEDKWWTGCMWGHTRLTWPEYVENRK